MEKFELYLDDDYLILIGRITVNFATLEQIVSFFIWNLIEFNEACKSILTDATTISSSQERPWIEYLMSTRSGLEKAPGKRLGQIITAELSFRQKIDLLSSIYRDKRDNSSELAELDRVLKRAVQAEQKRNTVVHSVWTAYAVNETPGRIKTIAKRRSKGLKLEIESISVKDLEDVANYIANVAYDIQTLVIRFYNPNFND